jgi:hypothetical protein
MHKSTITGRSVMVARETRATKRPELKYVRREGTCTTILYCRCAKSQTAIGHPNTTVTASEGRSRSEKNMTKTWWEQAEFSSVITHVTCATAVYSSVHAPTPVGDGSGGPRPAAERRSAPSRRLPVPCRAAETAVRVPTERQQRIISTQYPQC